jgi:hypothetical protein
MRREELLSDLSDQSGDPLTVRNEFVEFHQARFFGFPAHVQ